MQLKFEPKGILMDEQSLYTAEQASKTLNVSEASIRSWIHLKKLPVVRLGRAVRVKGEILVKIRDEGLESVSNFSINN